MGGGAGGGNFGHHYGAMAHHWRKDAHRVLTEELENRGIPVPRYYTGKDMLGAIFITMVICGLIFSLIWEIT